MITLSATLRTLLSASSIKLSSSVHRALVRQLSHGGKTGDTYIDDDDHDDDDDDLLGLAARGWITTHTDRR